MDGHLGDVVSSESTLSPDILQNDDWVLMDHRANQYTADIIDFVRTVRSLVFGVVLLFDLFRAEYGARGPLSFDIRPQRTLTDSKTLCRLRIGLVFVEDPGHGTSTELRMDEVLGSLVWRLHRVQCGRLQCGLQWVQCMDSVSVQRGRVIGTGWDM